MASSPMEMQEIQLTLNSAEQGESSIESSDTGVSGASAIHLQDDDTRNNPPSSSFCTSGPYKQVLLFKSPTEVDGQLLFYWISSLIRQGVSEFLINPTSTKAIAKVSQPISLEDIQRRCSSNLYLIHDIPLEVMEQQPTNALMVTSVQEKVDKQTICSYFSSKESGLVSGEFVHCKPLTQEGNTYFITYSNALASNEVFRKMIHHTDKFYFQVDEHYKDQGVFNLRVPNLFKSEKSCGKGLNTMLGDNGLCHAIGVTNIPKATDKDRLKFYFSFLARVMVSCVLQKADSSGYVVYFQEDIRILELAKLVDQMRDVNFPDIEIVPLKESCNLMLIVMDQSVNEQDIFEMVSTEIKGQDVQIKLAKSQDFADAYIIATSPNVTNHLLDLSPSFEPHLLLRCFNFLDESGDNAVPPSNVDNEERGITLSGKENDLTTPDVAAQSQNVDVSDQRDQVEKIQKEKHLVDYFRKYMLQDMLFQKETLGINFVTDSDILLDGCPAEVAHAKEQIERMFDLIFSECLEVDRSLVQSDLMQNLENNFQVLIVPMNESSTAQVPVCINTGNQISMHNPELNVKKNQTFTGFEGLPSVKVTKPKTELEVCGRIKVVVTIGYLEKSNKEVIVSSVGEELKLQKTLLGKALAKAAGVGLQAACDKIHRLQLGDAEFTDGYNLNCKKVLHCFLGGEYNNKISNQALEAMMVKTLEKIEKEKYLTASYPAFGTGKLEYPPNVTAEYMIRGIHNYAVKYPNTQIQEVEIVLFPHDNATQEGFSRVISWLENPKLKTTHLPKPSEYKSYIAEAAPEARTLSISYKGTIVNIVEGDVMKSKCQAILVIADDSHTAGNAKDRVQILPSTVSSHQTLVLASPSLKLDTIIKDCLRLCQKNKMTSVAIPGYIKGEIQLPGSVANDQLVTIFSLIDHYGEDLMKRIDVSILDDVLFSSYFDKMQNMARNDFFFHILDQNIRGEDVRDTSLPLSGNQASSTSQPSSVIIKIVGNGRHSVQNVVEHLKTLSTERGLNIRFHIEPSNSSIIPDDKNQQNKAADDQLVEKNLSSEQGQITTSQWQYFDESTKKWNEFPSEDNEVIKSHNAEKTDLKYLSAAFGGEVVIDFENETCQTPRNTYGIKFGRAKGGKDATGTSLPTKRPSKSIVTLKKSEAKYKEVEREFLLSIGDGRVQIEEIREITNTDSFKLFETYHDIIHEKNSSSSVIQQSLWHETSEDILDRNGDSLLYRDYSNSIAANGYGTYFAKRAQHFLKNPIPGIIPDRRRYMLKAAVVVGEYCRGYSGMLDTPSKADGDCYDSLVDDMLNPSVYVIFQDAAAFPEYVVVFKS